MTAAQVAPRRLLLLVFAAAPLFANSQFTVRRMNRNDVPLGRGQCDIRLQIDGEAEVDVRGDRVFIRTISGRDGRDDGSECNEPFPAGEVRNFNFEVKDSRGEIVLLDQPSRRNGNRAVVRIRDTKGGEGRYHFRLSWDMTGGGSSRPGLGGFGGGPQAPNRFTVAEAVTVCQDAVKSRIFNDYRFPRVDIRSARADDRPGRNDYIVGEATGRRGNVVSDFTFFCQVDFSSGRVRSVNLNQRR